MQNVSTAYRQSMETLARMNNSYIRVTLGIVNSKAQENMEVSKNSDLAYFSNKRTAFVGQIPDRIYATPEENFSKLDGTMFFLPKEDSGMTLYNNGLVSNEILGAITITFRGLKDLDIKGLTIDFGDAYPIDFTIENDKTVRQYTDNDKRLFMTEDSFDGTSFLTIRPQKMLNGLNRLRIYSISCGITNIFTNVEVTGYTEKEYVSPITETIPSRDVSVSVNNRNMYYNPDDAESALSYLEIGQEVKTSFGYDVTGNGDIEWLPEKTTYLSTWQANEQEATFTSTDIFDYMSGTYYRGKYYPEGISLYDLAVDVFADAGIEESKYYLDSYLKTVIVYNPMPVVGHGSALQIIANAGRCAMTEDRSGRIHIQPAFIPKMEVSANNETFYSHAENLLDGELKEFYAEPSNDFSVLDNSLRFMPTEESQFILNTGYISESVWIDVPDDIVTQRLSFRLGNDLKPFGIGGYWDGEMPKITIELEAAYTAFGMMIQFRNIAPKQFQITTYNGDDMVANFLVNNPDLSYISGETFSEFDRMEILFLRGYPNARVFVDNIVIGDNTEYNLYRRYMHTSPMATRQTKVKSISVERSIYRQIAQSEIKDLASDEIIIPKPDDGQQSGSYEYTVYFYNASYNLSASATLISTGKSVSVEIIDKSSYFATLRFNNVTSGSLIRFTVTGQEYLIEGHRYTVPYSKDGEEKTWSNPLVSTTEHARDLEEWLASFMLGEVEYEIDWIGDPRVDANDLFNLELKNGSMVKIRSYENTLNYNGRWSGQIKARRVAE